MAKHVDYYLSLNSPWTYLGSAPFAEIVRRYGATVDVKPAKFGPIFERWEADFGRTYVLGDDAACTPCATTYRWCGPRAGSTSSRARTSRGRSCSPTSSS